MNNNYDFSNLNLTFNHPMKELIWMSRQTNIPYKINLDTIIKNNKQSILTLYHNCDIVNDVKEVILNYHLIELCKRDFNENKKSYHSNYEIENNKHVIFSHCFNVFNDIND
jgi:hypothetical protein